MMNKMMCKDDSFMCCICELINQMNLDIETLRAIRAIILAIKDSHQVNIKFMDDNTVQIKSKLKQPVERLMVTININD